MVCLILYLMVTVPFYWWWTDQFCFSFVGHTTLQVTYCSMFCLFLKNKRSFQVGEAQYEKSFFFFFFVCVGERGLYGCAWMWMRVPIIGSLVFWQLSSFLQDDYLFAWNLHYVYCSWWRETFYSSYYWLPTDRDLRVFWDAERPNKRKTKLMIHHFNASESKLICSHNI